MTLARGEREWALLVSEYNICKKKLESKRQALKILMGDLESCQRERDIYKNKIRQMQQELDNFKRKEKEQESKEIRGVKSPPGKYSRSPEHAKFKRERKLSGHSIWEQELQSVRDRKNKTLSQLLCEAKEENKALKNDFMDLRVLYREAQEDIILLRENVARQKASDKDTGKMEDLEARQELIQRLEKNQEKMEELDREAKALTDEKNEIAIEREHYREKVERLNTQLNYILGADDRRLVDIDAILMENRYQKEQIKQLKEELRIASASLARQKAAMEKKKARLIKAGYNHHPSAFMGTGVKQALPSLISEISSSFGGVSSSTVNDLQSLANSLSESLSEKDIALLHQKNTNRILGHRVTELENKLKTLEVSGLWSLEGHRGYGSEEMAKLHLEKLKRSPHSLMTEADTTPTTDLNCKAESPSAESSPDLENMDSVFFAGGGHYDADEDELVDVSSPASASEGDVDAELDHFEFSGAKLGDEGSIDEDYQSMGDSHLVKDTSALEVSIKGDFYGTEDSPSRGDSHEPEDSLSRGDSHGTEDSPSKGDSHGTDDSPSEGDSHGTEDSPSRGDSHGIEDSPSKRDSHGTEDSPSKGDSHGTEDSPSRGDSHGTEDSPSRGDSHGTEDSPSKRYSHGSEDSPSKGDSHGSEDSPSKGDSHGTEDSPSRGDSHGTEDSPSRGDSHGTEDSPSKRYSHGTEDSPSRGDSHGTEDSPSRGDSHGTEDSPSKRYSHGSEDSQSKGDSHGTEESLSGWVSHGSEYCPLEETTSINGISSSKDPHIALDLSSTKQSLSVCDPSSIDNSPKNSPLKIDGNCFNNNLKSTDTSNSKDDIDLKNADEKQDNHEPKEEVPLDCKNEGTKEQNTTSQVVEAANTE